MLQPDEKQAFASRLKQALRRSAKRVESPTELALQFNLRHPNEPITPQAAQKWLTGKTRPTDDKIKTLAEWLDVSATWLRFGSKSDSEQSGRKGRQRADDSKLTEPEVELIRCFRQLPEHRQRILRELIEDLALDKEFRDL